MDFFDIVAESIQPHISEHLNTSEIKQLLEKPKSDDHGDVAFPAFQLARVFKKAPQEIASDLSEKVESPLIEKVQAVGPYLNFFLNRKAISQTILATILEEGEAYGNQTLGNGQNVPIDMSSPNIAKPMSMGHLRSTVIGNALSKIYDKMGYEPVKINHLGDWGTQFGKLITAYKLWGDEETVRANPIGELNKLYVQFHEEAEEKPELEDEGRKWFKRLEDGDEEAYELWSWFREESLKEFQLVYDRLDVTFDSYNGEAFYNDKMDRIIDILKEKGLLKEDEGAQVVFLDEYDLNPALIKKNDGATLYITRDLAAALYRKETYDFVESLYVVGQDQSYHFKQLKATLKEMDYDWSEDVHHIPFGLISIDGEKMSTRKGKVVLLNDVLDEAVVRASQQIEGKNPNLENKAEVSEEVGVGAVVFHDLKNERTNNFDFNLDDIVQFEGETGPYVQYSRARGMSILEKAKNAGIDFSSTDKLELDDDQSWTLIKLIEQFPKVIRQACDRKEPSVIARHALQVATAFNQFYAHVRVLDDHDEQAAHLQLVKATTVLIKEELRLLGVTSPDSM